MSKNLMPMLFYLPPLVRDTGITSKADNPNIRSSRNPISHVVREHFVMCSLYYNISFLFQGKYVSLVQSLKRTATHVVVLLQEMRRLALATCAHIPPGQNEVKHWQHMVMLITCSCYSFSVIKITSFSKHGIYIYNIIILCVSYMTEKHDFLNCKMYTHCKYFKNTSRHYTLRKFMIKSS